MCVQESKKTKTRKFTFISIKTFKLYGGLQEVEEGLIFKAV